MNGATYPLTHPIDHRSTFQPTKLQPAVLSADEKLLGEAMKQVKEEFREIQKNKGDGPDTKEELQFSEQEVRIACACQRR